jgi:hypothetical protein
MTYVLAFIAGLAGGVLGGVLYQYTGMFREAWALYQDQKLEEKREKLSNDAWSTAPDSDYTYPGPQKVVRKPGQNDMPRSMP